MTVLNNSQSHRKPPGQQWVAPEKWPIIGEREPRHSSEPWLLTLTVPSDSSDKELKLSLDQLNALPLSSITIDIHCVTRWSRKDMTFQGVRLSDLLSLTTVPATIKFISFVARSTRNHSTSMVLDDALKLETLIATHVDGEPIPSDHGGPIRNVVPDRYFYKSVKWLERIELLTEDHLGFWEAESGYHNQADPWLEQRYMAPTIDKRTAAALIASKDFSNKDLRSIDCSNRELTGLNAEGSLLRDGNFRKAKLCNSNFSNANLSNAHFESADLSNAKLVGADLEGASLVGANLSGADLTGCSLIGATFIEAGTPGAFFDSSTVIPRGLLTPLTPDQFVYVSSKIS